MAFLCFVTFIWQLLKKDGWMNWMKGYISMQINMAFLCYMTFIYKFLCSNKSRPLMWPVFSCTLLLSEPSVFELEAHVSLTRNDNFFNILTFCFCLNFPVWPILTLSGLTSCLQQNHLHKCMCWDKLLQRSCTESGCFICTSRWTTARVGCFLFISYICQLFSSFFPQFWFVKIQTPVHHF